MKISNWVRWASAGLVVGVGCNKTPPEPEAPAKVEATPAAATVAATATPAAQAKESANAKAPSEPSGSEGTKGGDPLQGKWTLDDARKDIKGKGALIAKFDTTVAKFECKLFEDKAPVTVANFVGLARGIRPWRDPKSGEWVKRPAYDGTIFHRIIKDFMIQGGDPAGNGTGEPGYVIPDEKWAGATHDRAGLLCMANRGPNTNGAQFFITDKAALHLDVSYTIFGECSPVSAIHDIAAVPVQGERPVSAPVINSVTIVREKRG